MSGLADGGLHPSAVPESPPFGKFTSHGRANHSCTGDGPGTGRLVPANALHVSNGPITSREERFPLITSGSL